MIDLPVRCACGALQGMLRDASPRSGTHAVCYCDDCQSFAYFLGEPRGLLDAHGGTEVFQTSPARLVLSSGTDRLACMRLRPNGIFRWYAGCCRTPIGNTLPSGKLPFLGLILTCVPAGAAERDAAFGPVRARVMGRYAKGDVSALGVSDAFPLSTMLRALGMVARARLRGDHKRSPFFDAATLAPVAVPQVLSAEELKAVERARG